MIDDIREQTERGWQRLMVRNFVIIARHCKPGPNWVPCDDCSKRTVIYAIAARKCLQFAEHGTLSDEECKNLQLTSFISDHRGIGALFKDKHTDEIHEFLLPNAQVERLITEGRSSDNL
jgi:hypothetical protein